MKQQQNDNSHASAQSRAEGANLTDVLAADLVTESAALEDAGFVWVEAEYGGAEPHWEGDYFAPARLIAIAKSGRIKGG